MNFEKLIQELVNNQWSATQNFIPNNFCVDLISDFKQVQFTKAKVGPGQSRIFLPEIRSDSIAWIYPETATTSQNIYLQLMEDLQATLNQELYLGLKEFECHLAHYLPGNFYQKHSDQFKGNNSRTVTAITYLNTPDEGGGELIIYKKNNPDEIDVIIQPQQGMLICFLSDQLYHEVKPTKSDRYSITGWFKNTKGL